MEKSYLRSMSDEELNKKNIRFNRWVLFVAALLIAGGFVLAIINDNDWWALAGCGLFALVLSLCGWKENHKNGKSSGGIVIALTFFFIYMAIKFIILSV
jgi:hypothetical protein